VLQRRSGLALGFSHYDQDLPEREGLRLTFERRAPSTVEVALRWLRKQGDEPVFLWVHLQDPHGPYTAPAQWLERVPPIELGPKDESALEVKAWDNPEHGIPAYQALEGLDRPSQYVRRYAAEIAYTDAALGQLIEGLAPRGEAAIVVTADHGESLGEAGRWFQHAHASTIDLARVPLAIAAPGVAPQRRLELAGHVDIAPTLLGFAGLQPLAPSNFGLSLVGPLRSLTALPDRTLFCDSAGEASAYRVDAHVRVTGFGSQTAAQAVAALEAGDVHSMRFSGTAANESGAWEPRVDRALADELRDYLRDEVAVVPATPKPETLQRLQALGYLGDTEAASQSEATP
jgi:arylsulfatase A-like enzyme